MGRKQDAGEDKAERERMPVGKKGLDGDGECESAVGWIRMLSGQRDIRVRGMTGIKNKRYTSPRNERSE